jgi:hypothetical protein
LFYKFCRLGALADHELIATPPSAGRQREGAQANARVLRFVWQEKDGLRASAHAFGLLQTTDGEAAIPYLHDGALGRRAI